MTWQNEIYSRRAGAETSNIRLLDQLNNEGIESMVAVAEQRLTHNRLQRPTTTAEPQRAVSRHPLANRILKLSATARQLINGPSAYRSADFVEWHKAAAALYGALPPQFEDRFYQRNFGRAHGVLTDQQIYAAFKTDMQATIDDLQRILTTLQNNPQKSRRTGVQTAQLHVFASEFPTTKAIIIATGLALLVVLGFGVMVLL